MAFVIVHPLFPHPNGIAGQTLLSKVILYGMEDHEGIIASLSWSGSGDNPKVAARLKVYEDRATPVRILKPDQLANIRLDGPVPAGDWRVWSRTGDFANTTDE